MDILENVVLPQSASHILLLKYILFLTLLILLPYLSVLIGTSLISYMHYRKGNNFEKKDYLIFAKQIIDILTFNKVMSFSLGIIPFISTIFCLSQLLYSSNLEITSNLFFSLILFIAALFYIYIYKNSFMLKNVFNLVDISKTEDNFLQSEFEEMKKSNSNLLSKSGLIGVILLLFVAWILISTLQIVNDPSRWGNDNSFLSLLFSFDSIIYFVFYITFSLALTSSVIIYKYFKSNSYVKYDNKILNYAKSFALKTGLIFTFILPLLFALTLISIPKSSLSFPIFLIGIFSLILILILGIQFYLMYKNSNTKLSPLTLFVFLILLATLIYRDQLAFNTATQLQVLKVEKEYDLYAAKLKEEAGISTIVAISGEDIYNGKCIACHRFNEKLVGPAYNEVLPKYENKRDALVSFILNPQKINPDYPAMPNQGLKPKEAEAIADYIVKVYNEKK